jgi:sugar lactone lactonase YvrE
MRRWAWLLALLCAIFVVAAQQSGHTTEVQKGFAWLRAEVQADGSIAGEAASQALPVQVRTETMHTLALLDSRPAELADLIGAQPQKHTELQARKALALRLANRDAQQVIADLGLQQNADGGFGSRREYGSNALDTSHALIALAATPDADPVRVANALTYLRTSRLSPSGWPVGDHPSVHVTSVVLLAGQAWSSRYQVGDITAAARDWLLGQRNAGGTYGNVVDDANALLALTTQTSDNAVLGPLADALRISQLDDGSWGEDPYVTAIALRALFRSTVGLPPSTTGAIAGSIVDSDTRAPIAGVTLTVRAMPELRVATAADGTFMLLGLPQGSHTVDIQVLGYVSTSFTATVTVGNTTSTGEIPLQKTTLTAEVSGVVRNSSGTLLANVVVSSGTVSTFTDSAGRYSLTGLNAGAATVTFALSGYRTVDVPVTLEPGKRYQLSPTLYTTGQTPPTTATIRGTVTQQANNQAIVGASVRVGTVTVTTNASGAFEITGLAPGAYSLAVQATGYLGMQGSVTLVAGINNVGAIALTRAPDTSTLVGVITDAQTNAPVPSAVLVVQGQTATAVSGPDGRYLLQGVQGASFTVIASGQGYNSRNLAISLPAIGQSTLDIELLPIGNSDVVFTSVATNRPIYRPSGEIELEIEVLNGGTVAAELVIDAEVQDPQGNVVHVFKANAMGLGQNPPNQPLRFDPGTLIEIEMDWVIARQQAGVYTVIARGRDVQGNVRAEGTTRFTVDSMPMLAGAVIADPPLTQVDSATPVSLRAELTNLGNQPIVAGQVDLRITLDAADANSNTVVRTTIEPLATFPNRSMAHLDRDAQGNFYMAEATRINRIAPDGSLSVLATVASITDLAAQDDGTVWTCSGRTLSRVTAQGVVSTYTVAPLGTCTALDVDNNGRVLIAGSAFSGSDHLLVRYVVGEAEQVLWRNGLYQPMGIARLASGGYAVANYGDGTINRVSEQGVVTPFATGLERPFDVIELPGGDLLVANSGGNNLIRVDSNGQRSVYATGLNQPVGLLLREDGAVFVSNQGNNTIALVGTDGQVSTYAQAFAHAPSGLARDADGSLIAANAGDGTVKRLRAGSVDALATGLGTTTALAADTQGNRYVANSAGRIHRVSATGVLTELASGLGAIGGLAIEDDRLLHASDVNGHRILHIDLETGTRTATSSMFVSPGLMRTAPNGRTFITNSSSFITVRNADGALSRFATVAPSTIAVRPEGGLYVLRSSIEVQRYDDSGTLVLGRTLPSHVYNMAARSDDKVLVVRYNGRYELEELDMATGTRRLVAALAGNPSFMASDGAGNVYYRIGNELHRITPQDVDTVITLALNGEGIRQFSIAGDDLLLVQTTSNNLYEYDPGTGTTTRRLTQFSTSSPFVRAADGTFQAVSGNGLALLSATGASTGYEAGFASPRGLAWTGSELRIIDSSYRLLRLSAPGAVPVRLVENFYASALAHDAGNGSTYGVGYSRYFMEYRSNATVATNTSLLPSGGSFTAIATLGSGRFAVADSTNSTVYVLQSGAIANVYGGFVSPRGLAFDPSGNLVVASYVSNTVVRLGGSDGVGEVVHSVSAPRYVKYGPDGALWISISGGVRRVAVDGSVTTASMSVNSAVNANDFELVGADLIVADYTTGLVKGRVGGTATLLAGGVRSTTGVAWTPAGLPALIDGTANAVHVLEGDALRQLHDRVPNARHLAFEPQGTLFTAGNSASLTRLLGNDLQRLQVGALISNPNFNGLHAFSDTISYVSAYAYNSAAGRNESTLYRVTATRPTTPVDVGQVVLTRSVPFAGLSPDVDGIEIDFGTWKPPYAGDFKIEVSIVGVEGKLTNFIHVGASAVGTLSVSPEDLPPGDQTAAMRLSLSGGDFTTLSRVELARLRKVVDISFPSGITADRAGNIYFTTATELHKVTPAGVRTTIATGLNVRFGLATDSQERLYFLQRNAAGRYDVARADTSGQYTIFANIDAASASGVAIDSVDNVYVAAPGRLIRITPQGSVTTVATTGFPSPRGITVDGKDNIYVQNDNHLVAQVTPDGKVFQLYAGGDGVDNPSFEGDGYPNITADCSDNLYIATWQWSKIGQNGEEHTLAQIVSRTGHVGLLVDTSRTVPRLTDIDYLAFDRFGQRIMLWDHSSSAIYSIPVTCGAISVDAHLFSQPGQTLTGFTMPPSATIPLADGRTEYVWSLRDVTVQGVSIDFGAPLKDLVLGEQRQTIDSGYLAFQNSFTSGEYRVPLQVPRVTVNNLVEMSVTTDQPEYDANETVRITATLRNPHHRLVDGRLVLEILDANGILVDEIHRGDVAIPANETLTVTDAYDVGSILPAGYSVRARLLDSTLNTAEASAGFVVLPANAQTAADARLMVDRAVYDPSDRVVITSSVANRSANVNLSDLILMVRVYDASDTLQYTGGHTVGLLLHGATRTFTAAQVLQNASPGAYRVVQVLQDESGRVYDTDETGYVVASTADTGIGVAGRISAVPHEADIGTPIALDVAAINTGNADLAGGTLIVRVLDPEHGLLLQGWEAPAAIAMGGEQDMDREWLSAQASAGDYVATLSLRIGDAERLLASTPFRLRENTIRIGLRQRLHHEGRLLVLASCIPGESPECWTRRKGEIEVLLDAIEVPHTVTTHYDTFMRLMRSGEFDAYWVSGGSLKLDQVLADEVIEAAFRGDGLIVDGVHDSRNQLLHTPMGVKYQGKLPLRQVVVDVDDTAIFDVAQFDIRDKTVRFDLAGASLHGRFGNGDPAVLARDFGRGHTVTLSFDFVETLKTSTSPDAMRETLRDAVAHALSGERGALAAGQTFGVLTTVFNQAGATPAWLQVLAASPLPILGTYPEALSRDANIAAWRFDLDVAQERDFTTWLRAPDSDGDYVVEASAGVGSVVGDNPQAQASTPVTVVSSERLVIDLIAEVEALEPTRAHEVQALRRVLEDIEMARGKVTAREYDLAIRVLLRARDSLLKVTTVDVTSTRLALSNYLAFVERTSTQQ